MDQLLNLSIEIEGLVRVVRSNYSEEAYKLLIEKSRLFNDMLNSLNILNVEVPHEPVADVVPDTNTIDNIDFSDDTVIENESDYDVKKDDAHQVVEEVEEEEETQAIEATEDTTPDIETISRVMLVDEEDMASAPEQTGYTTRLEDILAKKNYQNLAKAFTLNDKYRFIRGLFCDDKNDFDYTIAKISDFESLDEAYDYLLNELEWDIENDEVKDFISIISNYFNANC